MIKKRIRGQDLGQSIGEEVILLGTVTKVSPDGKYIELQTTDNVKVNITLPEPIDGGTEGYIEICGTAKSKSTLFAISYTRFHPEMCENFVAETYNEYLTLQTLLGNRKWRFSEDTSQLF